MTALTVVELLALVAAVGGALYLGERRREKRAAARADRQRLIERVRGEGILPLGRWLLERFRGRIVRLQQRATAQHERHVRLERRRDEASGQVWRNGKWSAGFILVVTVLGAVWLFLFLLQRNLDIQILEALGYRGLLAAALGSVIALVIATAGVLITGLVGLHPVLPEWVQWRRSLRVTLALGCTVLVLVLAFSLTKIAVYRAQNTFGPEVVQAENVDDAAHRAVPPDPLQISVADRKLTDLSARLQQAQNVDRTLAVVVPTAELMIGFAPVYLGELLTVAGFAAAASVAVGRERHANHRIAVITQEFRQEATDILFNAGRDPIEVEQLFPTVPASGETATEQTSSESPVEEVPAPRQPPPEETPDHRVATDPEPPPTTTHGNTDPGNTDPGDGWILA